MFPNQGYGQFDGGNRNGGPQNVQQQYWNVPLAAGQLQPVPHLGLTPSEEVYLRQQKNLIDRALLENDRVKLQAQQSAGTQQVPRPQSQDLSFQQHGLLPVLYPTYATPLLMAPPPQPQQYATPEGRIEELPSPSGSLRPLNGANNAGGYPNTQRLRPAQPSSAHVSSNQQSSYFTPSSYHAGPSSHHAGSSSHSVGPSSRSAGPSSYPPSTPAFLVSEQAHQSTSAFGTAFRMNGPQDGVQSQWHSNSATHVNNLSTFAPQRGGQQMGSVTPNPPSSKHSSTPSLPGAFARQHSGPAPLPSRSNPNRHVPPAPLQTLSNPNPATSLSIHEIKLAELRKRGGTVDISSLLDRVIPAPGIETSSHLGQSSRPPETPQQHIPLPPAPPPDFTARVIAPIPVRSSIHTTRGGHSSAPGPPAISQAPSKITTVPSNTGLPSEQQPNAPRPNVRLDLVQGSWPVSSVQPTPFVANTTAQSLPPIAPNSTLSESANNIVRPGNLESPSKSSKKRSLALDVLRALGTPKGGAGKRKRDGHAEQPSVAEKRGRSDSRVALSSPGGAAASIVDPDVLSTPTAQSGQVASTISQPISVDENSTSVARSVAMDMTPDHPVVKPDSPLSPPILSVVPPVPTTPATSGIQDTPRSPPSSTTINATSAMESHPTSATLLERVPYSLTADDDMSTTPPKSPHLVSDHSPPEPAVLSKGKQPLFLPDSSPEPSDESTPILGMAALSTNPTPSGSGSAIAGSKGKERRASHHPTSQNHEANSDDQVSAGLPGPAAFKHPIPGKIYRPRRLTVFVEIEPRPDLRRFHNRSQDVSQPGATDRANDEVEGRSQRAADAKAVPLDIQWRAQLLPCRWNGCEAVLDCVERLSFHIMKVHAKPLELKQTDRLNCAWRGCDGDKIYLNAEKLHSHVLIKHIRALQACQVVGCNVKRRGLHGRTLLEDHIKQTHWKSEKERELVLPTSLNPKDLPVPPELPKMPFAAFVCPPLVKPHPMDPTQHKNMRQWVFRQIHGQPSMPGPGSPKAPRKHSTERRQSFGASESMTKRKPFDFLLALDCEPSRQMADLEPLQHIRLPMGLGTVPDKPNSSKHHSNAASRASSHTNKGNTGADLTPPFTQTASSGKPSPKGESDGLAVVPTDGRVTGHRSQSALSATDPVANAMEEATEVEQLLL